MQRVLQIGNRHAKCLEMFSEQFRISGERRGSLFTTLCVDYEDFDEFVDACTQAVVSGYIRHYIDRVVYRGDTCFNMQERDLILKEVLGTMDAGKIRSAVINTACKNSVINLDGMFNFGLRDFCNEIDRLCTEVADKYILRNEYLDFIRTLRFFASVNYGSVDVIHVVMKSNNKADLYDESFDIYRGTDSRCGYEIAAEMLYEYDDIVSELVEASPLSVVLHNWRRYADCELIETLVNIFDERVRFCKGCSLCNREERC